MSSNSQEVLKDVFEIYQRLFDHSAAVRGEINYFLNNFKDGDDVPISSSLIDPKPHQPGPTQLETLLRCSQLSSESGDIDWEKTIRHSEIDKVTVKLDAAATMMEKLIERGRSRSGAGPYGDYVEQCKLDQVQELQQFSADIKKKRERVDEEFKDKVEDVTRHFEHLALNRSS